MTAPRRRVTPAVEAQRARGSSGAWGVAGAGGVEAVEQVLRDLGRCRRTAGYPNRDRQRPRQLRQLGLLADSDPAEQYAGGFQQHEHGVFGGRGTGARRHGACRCAVGRSTSRALPAATGAPARGQERPARVRTQSRRPHRRREGPHRDAPDAGGGVVSASGHAPAASHTRGGRRGAPRSRRRPTAQVRPVWSVARSGGVGLAVRAALRARAGGHVRSRLPKRARPGRRLRSSRVRFGAHSGCRVEHGGIEPPTSWVRSRRSPI